MMKMERQARRVRGSSHAGEETSSKYSRKHKTNASAKSKAEEDFDSMSIEEIDVLIEKAEREIEVNKELRRKVLKHKMMTKKMKHKKARPFEDAIKELKERVQKLEIIKDGKIPFYEKLPKDSSFYKHYMNLLSNKRITEITN